MESELENHHDPEKWLLLVPADVDARYSLRSDESVIRQWGVVLIARFIPCRVEHDHYGWHLLVPAEKMSTAVEELRNYEKENLNWPPPLLSYRQMPDNSLAVISILFLLATFHNITLLNTPFFGHPSPDWIYIGSAKVHLIHYGEWWRLITALTLHADWLHLLSNLTIGGFFVALLCRELGSGLAWTLLLTAGGLGNWANAQIQFPTHSSVGASTAVFGAVGILAAINLVRHRHHNSEGRWKLIVAAALALLTLLGTEGKNSDLGAHLFGFCFGVGLGIVTESIIAGRGRPGRIRNILFAVLSAIIVLTAWSAALINAG